MAAAGEDVGRKYIQFSISRAVTILALRLTRISADTADGELNPSLPPAQTVTATATVTARFGPSASGPARRHCHQRRLGPSRHGPDRAVSALIMIGDGNLNLWVQLTGRSRRPARGPPESLNFRASARRTVGLGAPGPVTVTVTV